MLPFLFCFNQTMGFPKSIYRVLMIWGIAYSYLSSTYAYDFFAESDQTQSIDADYRPENKDLNQIQKHLAEQHEQEENNYDVLKNPFYSNERINIYNYTAYNTDALKNKMINGASDHIGAHDLSISFGYGMTYKIDASHKIGYEYISSFPYDRGQLIRIFWIWSF